MRSTGPPDPWIRRAVAVGRVAAAAVVSLVLAPEVVLAYGGPGSVITGIGAFLAAVVAVAAAVVGFFWFPLKRLCQKLRGDDVSEDEDVAEAP